MDNNLKNKIEISDNKIKEVKDSLSLLKTIKLMILSYTKI